MGYSHWNNAAYSARQHHRKATGTTAFTYDAHVRATGHVQVHPQMDPHGVVRESRDSAEHPESVAIGVVFDVTGSMGHIPQVLQTKLGSLMRILIQRGYVAHPQVLFGAVGDATCDRVPLQMGQFESGMEMDDDLGKIFIEGGGGGQVHESYELAYYFFARHTAIDCWEKRGRKGYLFTIGDEMPYDRVFRQHMRDLLGDKAQADLPIAKIMAEVQERYEVFHIIPTDTYHGKEAKVQQAWRKLLGERVLLLDNPEAVSETIALTIGLCEGTLHSLEMGRVDLVDGGYTPADTDTAVAALAPFAKKRAPLVPVAAGSLPPSRITDPDGRF